MADNTDRDARILALRAQGLSYGAIAVEVGGVSGSRVGEIARAGATASVSPPDSEIASGSSSNTTEVVTAPPVANGYIKVRTRGNRTLSFRYEPGDTLRKAGVQAELITITPEGVSLPEGTALTAIANYEEVEQVGV